MLVCKIESFGIVIFLNLLPKQPNLLFLRNHRTPTDQPRVTTMTTDKPVFPNNPTRYPIFISTNKTFTFQCGGFICLNLDELFWTVHNDVKKHVYLRMLLFSKKGTIIYLVKSQVMTIAGGPIISGKPRDGIETTKIESGSKKEEIIFLKLFEIFEIFFKISLFCEILPGRVLMSVSMTW